MKPVLSFFKYIYLIFILQLSVNVVGRRGGVFSTNIFYHTPLPPAKIGLRKQCSIAIHRIGFNRILFCYSNEISIINN